MEEIKPKYNITIAKPIPVKWLDLFKVSSLPVFIASLCCLSPLLLLSFGLIGVSVASELADILYGTYKWIFRIVGLVALVTAFVLYLRRSGVCTLDEVRKRRNEIINKFIIVISVGVLGYIFFLYGAVHYLGVWLGVWK